MASESNPNGTVAVFLPSGEGNMDTKPSAWPLNASGTLTPPLPASCDMHDRLDGICSKDLKDDDDRTLIDPDIIRDIIIGLSDGLTAPFALAAGLSSLGSSRLVVVGGIAELMAGAISMGIGGFLASSAERDHCHYMRRHISARVQRSCVRQMEREVCAVLVPVGVDEQTCQAVTRCLRDAEFDPEVSANGSLSDEEAQLLRWKDQVGLTPFLLKFGEGMEDISIRRVYSSALIIGLGFLVGGIIPLIPYFFIPQAHVALVYSCIITGIVLLIFGAVKARVTGAGQGVGGYIWGAVSTLLVGGTAAAAAYALVAWLDDA
ncbi:VIT family-domain-containing protein [Suillus fuscotomentosus]|uniref:VIT family-domain-containing protein n=1 Tax=Suillus fuscotomentosus TaxID=1912939 RepID=A0AAD4EBT9_9AGAM|nr:VIT family-domain-containing protein [Suillus fuscotomentosus]KAG1903076.1 VIT family-domain-containing protein [Suillus fuscotomentosus]